MVGNQIPTQAKIESQSTRLMLIPTQQGSRDLSPTPTASPSSSKSMKWETLSKISL